jgi:DNA-binding NtrC family response regulator
LNVVEIALPPLRDRAEDIPHLIEYFLRKFTDRFGTGSVALSPALRQALCVASWPGNVRELEHRIERMVALSSGGVIDDDSTIGQAASKEIEDGFGLKEKVEAFERGLILQALREYGGNRSETARRLGIGRVTLLDKMKKYGIE